MDVARSRLCTKRKPVVSNTIETASCPATRTLRKFHVRAVCRSSCFSAWFTSFPTALSAGSKPQTSALTKTIQREYHNKRQSGETTR